MPTTTSEIISGTAPTNPPKNFLEAALHVCIKTRALARTKVVMGGNGTCASFGGARSVRWGKKRGRLVWSARPNIHLPTLEKGVYVLGQRVGAGEVRCLLRFSMFPPPEAAQSAPREAAARSVRMTRARGASSPPTLKTFFCTERLRVVYAFFSVSHTFLSDSIFLSTSI